METLGLGSTSEREDDFFQRVFWPAIHTQYDVDLISRRGFWLAVIVGLFSFVALVTSGQPIFAVFVLATFILGAAGIRHRDVTASAIVLCMYAAGILGNWIVALLGRASTGNPLLGLVGLMLLCANLRAAVQSKRWVENGTDVEFPEMTDTGAVDFAVNRFPAKVWPRYKWLFLCLGVCYFLLTVAGQVIIATRPAR